MNRAYLSVTESQCYALICVDDSRAQTVASPPSIHLSVAHQNDSNDSRTLMQPNGVSTISASTEHQTTSSVMHQNSANSIQYSTAASHASSDPPGTHDAQLTMHHYNATANAASALHQSSNSNSQLQLPQPDASTLYNAPSVLRNTHTPPYCRWLFFFIFGQKLTANQTISRALIMARQTRTDTNKVGARSCLKRLKASWEIYPVQTVLIAVS